MRNSFLAILVLAVTAASTAAEQGKSKKLIEFGWDEPDTAFMRAHVAEMEQTPFDGCVFHANATDGEGEAGFVHVGVLGEEGIQLGAVAEGP